jgi:hypothetical protein
MDNAQQQIVERLKEANNVLVTTSSNPSVDQLAATIGFTVLLNKVNKHATAVFSGQVPSTIEFLQPEKTLEKNTDSLRDFIIALDKSKADKLRYKVEDSHVKIFITPYRTSISEKDLDFSQGDFNVDLVVLLGIHDQKDLDQAITAHGRILHDATVASVSNTEGNALGSLNWTDKTASSLCEMLVGVTQQLGPNNLDGQIATALMTGIVAETARFSNDKTTATTMAISSALMAAGANQQLVANELQPKPVAPAVTAIDESESKTDKPADQPSAAAQQPPPDGTMRVSHQSGEKPEEKPEAKEELAPLAMVTEEATTEEEPKEEELEQIHIDEDGSLHPIAEMTEKKEPAPGTDQPAASSLVTTPPTLGGTLTANTFPEPLGGGNQPSGDTLGLPALSNKILSHDTPIGNSTPAELPMPPAEEKPTRTEDHGHLTIQPPDHHDEPPHHDLAELAKQEEALSTTAELPAPVMPLTMPGEGPGMPAGQSPSLPGTESPMPPPAEDPTLPHLNENAARDAVSQAMSGGPATPLPTPAAFNAQMLDPDVQGHPDMPVVPPPADEAIPGLPPNLVPLVAPQPVDNTASPMINPTAPPPVPPPIMPMPPGQSVTPDPQSPLPPESQAL